MATFKERSEARMFVRKLEEVSIELASWANVKVADGWTVEDIKIQLRSAMVVCERGS